MEELNITTQLKKFQDLLKLPKEMRWMEEGFTIIPNSVLIAEIPRELKMLYCILLMFAFKKGSCWPGVPKIADCLGVSDRAVQKNLKKLISVGWLRIDYRKGRTSVYTLLKT